MTLKSYLISSAEGKDKEQILITCVLDVMLGSNRKKYHISNVDIKFYGSLSINDAHLRGSDALKFKVTHSFR